LLIDEPCVSVVTIVRPLVRKLMMVSLGLIERLGRLMKQCISRRLVGIVRTLTV